VNGEEPYRIAVFIQVLSHNPEAVGMSCLAFSILSVGSIPGDIPYALSVRDVPLVGPARPLARGSTYIYFIEAPLCLMVSKIDLVSL
jgi:hypothetical protein